MRKITRIGIFSLARIMGGVGLVFGLIFGAIFSLVSLAGVGLAFAEGSGAEGFIGLVFGLGAVIVLPLLYGGFAFLQGLLTGFVVNLALSLFGGLEIELS